MLQHVDGEDAVEKPRLEVGLAWQSPVMALIFGNRSRIFADMFSRSSSV